MAFSACSSWRAACGLPLPPPPSPFPPRRSPAVAAFFPRRSGVPSLRLAPVGRPAAAKRGVRVMAVVKKYVGFRMKKRLARVIREVLQEAIEALARNEGSDACRVASDEVEEVSEGDRDPLERFCDDNPDSDECRVYEY